MAEKLVVEGFREFSGKHCETSSLQKVLNFHELSLSEEMLLGLGGGVGFIYWYMKMMPAPFIGTRFGKGENFLLTICKRIGAQATVIETNSSKKGLDELKALLRIGEPAVCYGDMVYLPYFAVPEIAHFGGHTFVVFGLDETKDEVYISDRAKKTVTVTIEDLQKARGSKFSPFAPKHRILRIKYPSKIEGLTCGIKQGIEDCCNNMLNPPISNIGLAGMQKWVDTVTRWSKQFKGLSLYGCLFNTFMYIEVSGTGGSAFRTMYAKFLEEASTYVAKPALQEIAEDFKECAKMWSEVAESALPDSWPQLQRIRELALEKNRFFEEQRPDALEKMKNINLELDDRAKTASEELQAKNSVPLLLGLKQKIAECYELEKKTFKRLNNIMK